MAEAEPKTHVIVDDDTNTVYIVLDSEENQDENEEQIQNVSFIEMHDSSSDQDIVVDNNNKAQEHNQEVDRNNTGKCSIVEHNYHHQGEVIGNDEQCQNKRTVESDGHHQEGVIENDKQCQDERIVESDNHHHQEGVIENDKQYQDKNIVETDAHQQKELAAGDKIREILNTDKNDDTNNEKNTINPNSNAKSILEARLTNELSYKCSKCRYTSPNMEDVQKHLLICKGRSELLKICRDCKKTFLPTKHLRTRAEQSVRCEACYVAFLKAVRTRLLELQATINQKSNLCEVCGKSFSTPHRLKSHVLEHTGAKPHKCTQCTVAFRRKDNLVKHIRTIHSGIKSHKCVHCGDAFTGRRYLNEHFRLQHPDKVPKTLRRRQHCPKTYTCQTCNKEFKMKTQLQIHNRTHTGERPYKCTVCDAAFRQVGGLKTHFLLHTGEKPYICDVCGADFRHKQGLEIHMRKHTGEKPFKCEDCDCAFMSSRSLIKHRLIHDAGSEDRPLKCAVCGGGFLRKRNLVLHMRVHQACSVPQDTFVLPVDTVEVIVS